MNLSKRILHCLSDEFVLRINELYHDKENVGYLVRQNSMFILEQNRWKEIGNKYLSTNREPKTLLDFGTGTGFVPLTFDCYLSEDDHLICEDISSEMLKVCEQNLSVLSCKKTFKKTNGKSFELPDSSLDFITVNAVLHHLPDLNSFSQLCKNALKPTGKLIVVHEPSKSTELSFINKAVISFYQLILEPKQLAIHFVERYSIFEKIFRPLLGFISSSYKKRNRMLAEIAYEIQKEGWVDFKLRGTEIQQIVDIHTEKRFAKEEILEIFNEGWRLIDWRTFNIFGKNNDFFNKKERKLIKKYPNAGKTMMFILEKE